MTLSLDIRLKQGSFALQAALDCPPGVTVVFGPSGSGKTTLLQCVAGLVQPDQGRIALNGLDWNAGPVPPHRRAVGYVFQDGRLFPHMTVAQNIAFPQRLRGGKAEGDAWIDLLGLANLLHRMPATLSGGERQRVALARAMASTPSVLCLDEPLSALDGPRRAAVLPYLEQVMATANIPVLYVTHDIAELTRLAHRVALMDQGQIVMTGSLDDVMTAPGARPYLPGRSLGAVLDCQVGATDQGVTTLHFAGGALRLSQVNRNLGTKMRLRVAAQDVILSKTAPVGLSALNILQAIVARVDEVDQAVVVTLQVGQTKLLSRITQVSAQAMAITPGDPVHAIVKATAMDAVA